MTKRLVIMDRVYKCLVITIMVCLIPASYATAGNNTCKFTKLKHVEEQNSRIEPALEKYESALLMILGFGGFSVLVALLHNCIRYYIYRDLHSIDTIFDAGGKVSLSLTAVTVTSQMLWPADFLQISTNSIMSGLGGAFFFVVGIVLGIVAFPILSVELKSKAPGAKTYLQIIYARFGRPAHILFCFIALFSNIINMTSLLLAGKSSLVALTKDASDEFIVLTLALLFGSYCFIGGIGTTFYISYFNTALTFVSVAIFALNINHQNSENIKFASKESMYEAARCISGPDGNYENSLLSFQSRSGAIFGLALFIMATSLSFTDQANWQSRIAAKPTQGVLGFFIAGCLFFALPMNIGLPAGLSYLAMGYENGTHFLSESDIVNGYITPFVMEAMMSSTGGYLLITMVTMALMSTGSGEVMALSSILVYDIYKIYINPFRSGSSPSECQLCGKKRVIRIMTTMDENEILATNENDNIAVNEDTECACVDVSSCTRCTEDIANRMRQRHSWDFQYSCDIHGHYRSYEDMLLHYKSWCIVWVTIAIIPFGLVLYSSDINLNWAVFFLQAMITPFIIPLLLTVTWSKCTSSGVFSGIISGMVANISSLFLITATVYESGFTNFFINSVQDYTILGGCIAGLVVSCSVVVTVSMAKNNITTEDDTVKEWAKTIAIDNPLSPWKRLYEEELSIFPNNTIITSQHLTKVFKTARYIAYIGGFVCILLFLIVIPSVVLSLEVLSFNQFENWLSFCNVTCIIGTGYVVIAPPIEEIIQIIKQNRLKRNEKRKKKKTTAVNDHEKRFTKL